jgi:predicted negative regulator of RcsB-dependent stress response
MKGCGSLTGITGQYWFTSGSSGSPLFLDAGQQLAGILSLSELGANEGKTPLREAFIVPAMVIRRFAARRVAQPVAEDKGVDPPGLQPLLDNLQALGVPIAEIPELLRRYIDDAHARAAEPVQPSNDGSDIEAVIGASRDKLRVLDVRGARDVLQAKIIDEEQARLKRLVPLLKERAWVERLSFDYDGAKSTLDESTDLAPDDVPAWIDLGDLWRLTGSLESAANAYQSAEAAARHTGDERDLSVSHDRIGDVLVAQGDRDGALKAYQAGLAIAEALAGRDPANTEWQRDLSVSHNKIGDVLVAQGDRDGALKAYQAGLAIAETLARRDPANAEWQRDLSVSQIKIGDVLVAQGDRDGALKAYQAGLAIRETLARRDPANTQWQRDLSVSQERIGDVLVAQGDRDGALKAYQAGLAIVEALARRDPANTEWQRDLIVSYVKISESDPAESRRCLSQALEIARGLQTTGRLAPVDDWMLDDLARRLAAMK